MIANSVVLTNQDNFNIKQIFECGQAFRFNKTSDGGYEGVAFGRYIKLEQCKKDIKIDADPLDFQNIWNDFFDLDRDYQNIIDILSKDEVMAKAAAFGSGIRILRQDLFECLLSFIISQQNNIPRIKSIIECFCMNFGEKIETEKKTFYAFPTLKRLENATIDDLSVLRCGFRAKYIRDALDKILWGDIDLGALYTMDTDTARCQLLKIKGVGAKVADCILLFGAGKLDAFPVDVWIGRAIGAFYKDKDFSPDIFGPYAGIAQQYLFYYARENKIKI